MAADKARSFAFVLADSHGRPQATDRKMIRSQCMKGQNKKRKTRESLRRTSPAPEAQHPSLSPSSNSSSDVTVHTPESLLGSASVVVVESEFSAQPMEYDESILAKANSMPPAPPPDLSLVTLADHVDIPSQKLLFMHIQASKNSMYPSELFIDFDISSLNWFPWLFEDKAYLHALLFSTSALSDAVWRLPFSGKSAFHLKKTLTHLNESISKPSSHVKDSTVSTVLTLANVANLMGDEASVKAHVLGLQRMVRIRGGLQGFCNNTKLFMKLGRADLAFSWRTGQEPHFLPNTISWEPLFPDAILNCSSLRYMEMLSDMRLSTIFQDLICFTQKINNVTRPYRLKKTYFQESISSIQYRLMALQDSLEDIVSECLRLAMLAFLATTFELSQFKRQYPFFAKRYRECCCSIETTTPELRNLMPWLLIFGAMTLYDVTEPWLVERWRENVSEMEWMVAKQYFQDIMWIHVIHDRPGRLTFESLNAAAFAASNASSTSS